MSIRTVPSRERKARRALRMEVLEPRWMMSATDEAQQFTYLLNRIRQTPDLIAAPNVSSDSGSMPPLVFDQRLSESAARRLLSGLTTSDEASVPAPNQAVREAGFPLPSAWPNEENFVESTISGAQLANGATALTAFLGSGGNQQTLAAAQLLGRGIEFSAVTSLGIAYHSTTGGPLEDHWLIHAAPDRLARPSLTGVVFDDVNANGIYDSGEGLADITVSNGTLSTRTNSAGGWSLEVAPGVHTVVASGGEFRGTGRAFVTVTDRNVALDFIADRPVGIESFATWRNALVETDVNGDSHTSPIDALLIINRLNTTGTEALDDGRDDLRQAGHYVDVSGDRYLSSLDALRVVNELNSRGSSQYETPAAADLISRSLFVATAAEVADAEGVIVTPIDQENLVNTLVPRLQTSEAESTAVATNAAGQTVMTFTGRGPLDDVAVFARRFDANGAPLGEAFQVNTTVRENQRRPSIAMDALGNFVVTWEGRGPGDQYGIFAQWFAVDGGRLGAETLINTTVGGQQQDVSVGMSEAGEATFVWSGVGNGDLDGVFLRRFAPDRSPRGAEQRVNTTTANEQAFPSIGVAADGQAIVTWSSKHQDGSDWGVYGQRYSAAGDKLGGEFSVHARGQASQYRPSVDMANDGSFVVAWSGYRADGQSWDIFARRFDADGQPRGDEFTVNRQSAGHQKDVSVAMSGGGSYVITWTSGVPDGSGWEIMANVYDATDASQEEFQVNTVVVGRGSGHQQFSAVAIGGGPRALITWSGRGVLDHSGVFRRPFESEVLRDCQFAADFTNPTIVESGGSFADHGTVVEEDCAVSLTEGDSFLVGLELSFVVPDRPTALTFTYDQLSFDTTSAGLIKDAFEVAVLDADGNPLTGNFVPGRDAVFNVTDGLPPQFGAGVTADGTTVTIGLNGIAPGTAGRLVFRMVNNDHDRASGVRITGVEVVDSNLAAAVPRNLQLGESLRRQTVDSRARYVTSGTAAQDEVARRGVGTAVGFTSSDSGDGGESPTLITDPDDPRVWQQATVGTFAQLYFGADTPENRRQVVDRRLLDAGVFDTSATRSATLVPTPWTSSGGGCIGASSDLTGTGDYGYGCGATNLTTAANSIDNLFFQTSGTIGETVFDLGVPSPKAAIFNTIDHGPLPQEAIESTIYLSNDRATWTEAVVERVWLEGFQKNQGILWDGFVYAVGTATGEDFRYVSVIHGGPGALISDGDNEINGVLGLDENFNPTSRPALRIFASAPDDRATIGDQIVVTGKVEGLIRGSDWGPVGVDHVEINGIPVTILDSVGGFFATISVASGDNLLRITAHTSDGRQVAATLNVIGVNPVSSDIDFSRFADVTDSFSGVYGRTSFHADDEFLHADLATRNDGQFVTDVPLLVGVRNISDPTVSVAGVDGYLPDGTPYYDYTSRIPSGKLAPGQLSESPTITFHNPARARFDYDLVFYGQLNEAPVITTLPDIEALIGRPYVYDVDATDADQDPLAFSLAVAPAGMSIDAATGRITWTPGSSQLGQHDVTVRVTDGRGGSAEQHFVLAVVPAPPNRPPLITSTPVTSHFGVVARGDGFADVVLDYFAAGSSGIAEPYGGNINPNRVLGRVEPVDPAVAIGSPGTGPFTSQNRSVDWLALPSGSHVTLGFIDEIVIDGPGDDIFIRSTDPSDSAGERANVYVSDNGIDFLFLGQVRQLGRQGLDLAEIGFTRPVRAVRIEGVDNLGWSPGFDLFSVEVFPNSIGNVADYQYDVKATDPDADHLTFTLTLNPAGMQINPVSGAIRWSPTAEQIGDHPVKVRVDDGRGGVAEQEFVVCVHGDPANHAPVIVSEPLTDFLITGANNPAQGTTDPQQITVTGETVGTISRTVSLTLPNSGGDLGTADIVFIVDESGSMAGEQAWLGSIIGQLDASLVAAGLRNNRYGLVGFADTGRIVQSGADRWMNATQFASAATLLRTNRSGNEDGYDGVNFALNNYVFRSGASPNLILITDEERTTVNGALTYSSIVNKVRAANVNLSIVANANLEDGNGVAAFGVAADGTSYVAAGQGGFTTGVGGRFVGSEPVGGGATANIKPEYVDLTWELDGVTWDLNFLRQDQAAAAAFTTVFVDIVGENIVRDTPITVVASNASVGFVNVTGPQSNIGPGETVSFQITFSADTSGRFDIAFINANTQAVLGSIPVTVRGQYEYHVAALDADDDPLTFRLTKAPAGMTIGAATGVISWNAPVSTATHDVEVEVTDGRGGFARQVFTIATNATGNNELRGRLFEDVNGDGLRGADEPDLSGWVVYLDQNGNAFRDPGEMFALSNLTGRYAFAQLPGDSYAIRAENRSGWTSTHPVPATPDSLEGYSVDLLAGTVVDSLDFGRRRAADSTNHDPEFLNGPSVAAIATQVYRYSAIVRDDDHDSITFDLAVAPAGMTVHPTLGTVVWSPSKEDVGDHQVVLRARDGRGGVTLQAFTIQTVEPNAPPTIVSTPPSVATVGRTLAYAVLAQDAEGDPLTFRLTAAPPGMAVDASTGQITWTPATGQVGLHQVQVVVDDGHGEATQRFALNVSATDQNVAPRWTSTPGTSAVAGLPYLYALTADDANGDPLSFAFDQGPVGMMIDSQGTLAWTPSFDQVAATGHLVQVSVSDGRGGTNHQQFQVTVATELSNGAPDIVSNPPLIAVQDREYVYDLRAVDPDLDRLSWQLDAAPAGMSLDTARGTLRWQPREDQLGTHRVIVSVRDDLLHVDSQSFVIDVRCVNTAPAIVSVPKTAAVAGRSYLYAVRAEDIERDAVTFALPTKPTGMSIDSQTGVIRWSPTASQIGLHNVVITATDSAGAVGRQTYAIKVGTATDPVDPTNPNSPPAGNRTPIITSTPVFAADVDSPYEYAVLAIDPDGDTLTYSVSPMPAGMTINSATGRILWTPDAQQVGEQVLTVVATDSHNASTTQGFALLVKANQPPRIVSSPITSTTAGATYRYSVRATDPDGDPLTYRLESAPDGMSIDRLGRILWTSQATTPSPQSVAVVVADSHGRTDRQAFTIDLTADTEPPRVALTIRTNDGTFAGDTQVNLNASYVVTVSATDNVAVADVGLLIGGQRVALDANQSVRLSAAALGAVTLSGIATDAAGLSGSAEVIVTIIDPAQPNQPRPTDPTLPAHPGFAPSDVTEPTVTITSPAVGASVSNQVPIIGTVDDPDNNLWYYRAYVARADLVSLTNIDLADADWSMFHQSTQEVINGELAVLDASKLSNDAYAITVAGFDVNGRGYVAATLVYVEGNLLVGNFRLEFTDLSLPLVGIPIEVTRVYDTLDAGREGDFGYGWSLGVQDARIFEAGAIGTGGVLDGANDRLVPDKSKVYLTTPAGKRVGFTYREAYQGGAAFIIGCAFGCFYRPYFDPDPGVYETLTIDETQVTRGGILGAFSQGINPTFYTLTTKEGLKYRYHDQDGLVSITDRNGNVATFTESGVTHSSGESIAFVRDHRGRIKEIVAPDGIRVGYQYDAAGDLRKMTDPVDLKTSYVYRANPAHYLSEAYDSLGVRVLTAEYDSDDVFVGVLDALGNRVDQRDFDTDNNTGIIRDGNGNATTILYDDRGNVLEETDPLGNKTLRRYEDPRNPDLETTIIDRRGMITERQYDARGNVTTITERGSAGQPLNPPVVTAFTYDAGNRVSSIKNAKGGTTVFAYDAQGNLTKITNAVGDNSSFTYDSQGRRQTFTDFNGNTTTFDYDGACPCGSPGKVIFADGTYQRYFYNTYGQVTGEQFFEADGTLVQQKFTTYDDAGRVTHEFDGEAIGGKWNSVRRFYDAAGNVDWEILVDPRSTTNTGVRDGLFNQLVADLNGTKEQLIAAGQSRITDFDYDANKRLIRQVDAEGGVIEFRYDSQGNRIALMDPVGNITTWLYDGLNRVIEERDPLYWDDLKARDAAFAQLSDFDYLNEIAPLASGSIADPLYDDPSGASCATNTGASHVRLTCYDAQGNQAKTVDRNARRREFQYDHAGRLTEERWYNEPTHATAPGALVETITFSYDVLGNMLTASDSNSNYLHTYDTLSRLTSVDNNPDGTRAVPRVILTYGYDKQGNVTLTRDDSGVTVASAYDLRNRLKIRRWFDADGSGDVADARIDFRYNAAGRETEVRRYANLAATSFVGTTTRTYDLAGRSDDLIHRNATSSLIAGYDYDYDFAGLVIHEARTHQDPQYAQTIDYAYDLTGQLIQALFSGQEPELYQFDANGNRLMSSVGSDVRAYVFGTANYLVSDGKYVYEYDGEGNQVKRIGLATGETQTLSYDHRNRLVSVDSWSRDPGQATTPAPGAILIRRSIYSYDTFGATPAVRSKDVADSIPGSNEATSYNRNARSVPKQSRLIKVTYDADGAGPQAAQSKHIVYDVQNAWSDRSNDHLSSRFLFGSDIDWSLGRFSDAQDVEWYLMDSLGSVRDLLSLGNATVEHTSYESFGNPVSRPATFDRFSFTGRELDAVGNIYFRTRWYSPEQGRFLSQDRLRFEAVDANLYRYSGNSPANATDPTGESFIERALLQSRILLQLFARGGSKIGSQASGLPGLLNGNNFFRIGLGWNNVIGCLVFRIALGSADALFHWHFDLFRLRGTCV